MQSAGIETDSHIELLEFGPRTLNLLGGLVHPHFYRSVPKRSPHEGPDYPLRVRLGFKHLTISVRVANSTFDLALRHPLREYIFFISRTQSSTTHHMPGRHLIHI